MWLIFIMYVIIIACKFVSLCHDFTNYDEVMYLLKLLNIKDKQLYRISWEDIISRLGVYVNEIDVYTINSKICIRDNYFITMIDKDLFNLGFLSIPSIIIFFENNLKIGSPISPKPITKSFSIIRRHYL